MRNLPLRLLLLAPLVVVAMRRESFVAHVTYFLSGDVARDVIMNDWKMVALHILVFLSFLVFLSMRKRLDWSPAHVGGVGVYAAFIVSLFVEMYGVPLTIFLGQGLISAPPQPPSYIGVVTVLGTTLAFNLWMVIGAVITFLGMVVVLAGWWQVYTADGLVTTGLYRYSRNPQYLGILLIAAGWVIGWPSLLTLVMFPILVAAYIHLCQTEHREMREMYGDEYVSYAEQVPLLA